MSKINGFSLRRLLQLIRMELVIIGKQIMLASVLIVVGVVSLSLLSGFSDAVYVPGHVGLWVLESLWFYIICIYLLYFAFKMNERIRDSDTIAYCVIPSSTEERFLSILLLGVIYFLAAWLVAQVTLSILLLINPSAGVALASNPHSSLISSVGPFRYYSITEFLRVFLQFPFVWLFLSIVLYSIISSKSAFGWNANRWWEKLMFVLVVCVGMLPAYYGQYSMRWYIVLLWLLAVGIFVGSFFRLKYIDQR